MSSLDPPGALVVRATVDNVSCVFLMKHTAIVTYYQTYVEILPVVRKAKPFCICFSGHSEETPHGCSCKSPMNA